MSWEPTKVVCKCGSSLISRWTSEINEWQNLHKVCLNTVSPIKEWVGLTDEEIEQIYMDTLNFQQNARALEAKLKHRNT